MAYRECSSDRQSESDPETEMVLSSRDESDVPSNSASWEASSYSDSREIGSPEAEDEEDEAQDSADNDPATKEMFAAKVTDFIRQMMFVSGETAEPSIETTTLIEDIVRQQVVEIVCHIPRLDCRHLLTHM